MALSCLWPSVLGSLYLYLRSSLSLYLHIYPLDIFPYVLYVKRPAAYLCARRRPASFPLFSALFLSLFSLFLSFSSPYYPISLPQCLALGHFLARHPACAQVSVPLSSSLICSSIPRLKSQKIPPLRFFKVHRFFANVIYANCGSVKIPQNSVFICYFYHFVQYYFFKAGMYKNQISDLRLRLTQCSSKFVYAFIFWKLSRKVR